MSDLPASSSAGLQGAFRTDPGRVRTNNEDLAFVDLDRGVYGVIDGVGGHAAGEVAAAIARDVILQRLARPLGTPAERVREAIAIANNEIFKRADQSASHHGMTCVVTVALVTDGLLTIGHVGDSRLYKLRADGMRKLTHDHSPIGEREDAREITEVDAMRHPRRHEVFRDVGSAHRDKDDPDFVEVIEESMEPDSAILLCTDGLTDMVPSVALEQIVRQHAGSPREVVDALVGAANDAGGKDNVTVVYAEAPGFARAATANQASAEHSTRPAPAAEQTSGVALFTRWVVRSRTTWFAVGALVGVAATLALIWRVGGTNPGRGRTLVVEAAGTGRFPRIADAMNAARPGDLVRLEPGVYRERIFVPDGVDLAARVPGSVTLARPADADGEWIGVTAFGDRSGRISGIRIESTPELPMDIGMRISGQGRTIELVDITGPMQAGIELRQAGTVTIQGSLFAVQGPAVTIAGGSEAVLINNVFLRIGRSVETPISIADSARGALKRNAFVGFGTDIVTGVSADERLQMLSGNFVIASEPSLVR
jgi:serine/threonine protein phosphatase PrpC